MASQYLQKFPVPEGFMNLLADLTKCIIRDQPTDIIQYSTFYFEALERGQTIQSSPKSAEGVISEDNYQPTQAQAGGNTEKAITDEYINNMTERQINQEVLNQMCAQIFQQYDTNKSGLLQRTQVRPLVQKIAQEMSGNSNVNEKQFDQFMQFIDTNNNGKICMGEFKDLMRKIML